MKDEFCDLVRKHMDASFGANKNAKIINKFHAERILGYFKNHGGEVIYGNCAYDEKELKIERTIVLNPKKDSDLA